MEIYGGRYVLVRLSDNKDLFATPPCNSEGLRYSNGIAPTLVGVVAQVKSKGWILELDVL